MYAKSSLPGVNLGGWLVLEKWMTPSLFAGTSATNEYELVKTPGGAKKIQKHHATFITEADFVYLQRAGIEAIRVPVGFWVLHGYGPYVSAKSQLDWVFSMSKKYHIKVLLCLHAAPGPQNTNDHSGSGKPGQASWYRRFNKAMTTSVLEELAERYRSEPALWGIELLNEPSVKTLRQGVQMWLWNRRTTKSLRRIIPAHVRIVISDCYQPRLWSGRVGKATLDIHHYQCFSPSDVAKTFYAEHREALQQSAARYARYHLQQPYIIGEWSATLPKVVRSYQTMRQFVEDQHATVLSEADAWFFWSYKTEHGGSWSFRWLHERGYFDTLM